MANLGQKVLVNQVNFEINILITYLDQCNGTEVQSPFDACNTCRCEDGLVTQTCTEIGCLRGS